MWDTRLGKGDFEFIDMALSRDLGFNIMEKTLQASLTTVQGWTIEAYR